MEKDEIGFDLALISKVVTKKKSLRSTNKFCKMNLNQSEREMEVAAAANVACSFLLSKKSKERYQMAYKCFVWFNFCQFLPLGR
jgi:hypothetical protein